MNLLFANNFAFSLLSVYISINRFSKRQVRSSTLYEKSQILKPLLSAPASTKGSLSCLSICVLLLALSEQFLCQTHLPMLHSILSGKRKIQTSPFLCLLTVSQLIYKTELPIWHLLINQGEGWSNCLVQLLLF